MPQSHTYENIDFPELPNESETIPRKINTKLFATSTSSSTTEIFERKPLFRSSSSLLSNYSSSSSFGSSSGTINSNNSSFSGAIHSGIDAHCSSVSFNINMESQKDKDQNQNSQKRNSQARRVSESSDARFSQYLSSTSSWDWECECEDEFPDTQEPIVFPYRKLSSGKTSGSGVGTIGTYGSKGSHSSSPSSSSYNRDEKCRSSLSSGYFSDLEVTTVVNTNPVSNRPVYQHPPFPDPLSPTPSSSTSTSMASTAIIAHSKENKVKNYEQEPSTSRLAAAGIFRASCPSLHTIDSSMILPVNDEFRRKLRARHADDFSDVSVSTVDIGPPKVEEVKAKPNTGKVLLTSKSSGCLAAVNVRGYTTFFLNRPITLRFTPSGLTESHKVVWVSEGGNHSGTVKWVGKIRGVLYAGVEFEKAIGNSSGIYGYGHGLQIRLFTCKLGYGRFIPVDQLILYEDFYENQKTGFICIICRDDFLEPGQNDDLDLPEKIMVATKCGHLFHQKCLNQWFNEKSAAIQHCPYCQSPMERNDTIRIFPAQLK